MGIYDRDYYRESNRGLLGSVLPEGGVCKILIIAQLVMFGVQALAGESFAALASDLALQPSAVMHGEVWRIVTFGFLHPSLDPWSLAFGLLFLWYFGSDLEQMYGSAEFLCFYIAAIVVGGLAFMGVAYFRGHPEAYLVGCLGPITAITVLYAWHFPSQTIRLFLILPIPIWLLVVIQIAGAMFLAREQMAYVLAGAAFGSLYYKKQWRLSSVFQGWQSRKIRPKQRASRLRVFSPDDDEHEPVAVAAPKISAPLLDEHLEAKVDSVLEKMARSGKESLSDQERQILLQASEIYRRKRT
ncbi:MAG: rhomboid family intramembrane serine protease [Planctomycetota bacterium]